MFAVINLRLVLNRLLLPFPSRGRSWLRLVGLVLGVIWLGLFAYHLAKPLPEGVSAAWPSHEASAIEFLYDLTYRVDEGKVDERRVVEQNIFDRVFRLIDEAEEFVVVDMFLFNGEGEGDESFRPLAAQLTQRLISRKVAKPGLKATVITDEINNFYGAYTSPEIAGLREAGVEVILTRMTRLRDSNPAYSAAWRMFVGWMGTAGPGWLPDILSTSGQKVTARSYLKLLNFKANHRKTVVTDGGCLVTSANPHDASSLHSNIAFAGSGPICADLLASERSVAAFSGRAVEDWPAYPPQPARTGLIQEKDMEPSRVESTEAIRAESTELTRDGGSEPARPDAHEPAATSGTVRLITEGEIREAVLDAVASAGPGDSIDLAMFYLSERSVVNALLKAEGRGVQVRAVLDPNRDAFGRQKGGIPNRQVASELVSRSDGRIALRWYDTHGEQFHTKMMIVTDPDSVVVIGGSANFTRRNLGDFNLETDLLLAVPRDAPLAHSVSAYFQRLFANQGGHYTLPFPAYQDDSLLKKAFYRLQELTGFCSF